VWSRRFHRHCGNKVCAKIAAGVQKPDGLVIVPRGTEREFLAPLPVEVIPGVGVKTLPETPCVRSPDRRRRHGSGGADRRCRVAFPAGFPLCPYCSVRDPSDEPLMVEEQVEKSISRDRTFS